MSLLAATNLPFVLALAALGVIALVQVTGLGDVLDSDADAGGGLELGGFGDAVIALLGLGRVPLLIWLASLLLVFGSIGLIGQMWIADWLGGPLSAGWAVLAAGAAALPLNSLAMRPLAAVMPKDETTAIALDELVRRDAEIQIGTARAGSPARARVIDRHGQAHHVMVEPHDSASELRAGDTVLLVHREGETFFAIHYESPLLGLES
jgi:hypothetical protein